jgi:hypothetical protein
MKRMVNYWTSDCIRKPLQIHFDRQTIESVRLATIFVEITLRKTLNQTKWGGRFWDVKREKLEERSLKNFKINLILKHNLEVAQLLTIIAPFQTIVAQTAAEQTSCNHRKKTLFYVPSMKMSGETNELFFHWWRQSIGHSEYESYKGA